MLIYSSSKDILFGRDKFPLAELQPFVPRAFEILRRWHFNRIRRQYKDTIAGINDINRLADITNLWHAEHFGTQALSLLAKRVLEIRGTAQ